MSEPELGDESIRGIAANRADRKRPRLSRRALRLYCPAAPDGPSAAPAPVRPDRMTMTPRFLYVPWVKAHGDWLIEAIAGACAACFEPLRLFAPDDDAARRELLSLAALRPGAVEQAMRRRLRDLGGVAHGLVLTHDWPAPLAAAARVANAIGLPTVLVPHESVFFSRARFYRDVRGPQVAPVCRHALVWGGLQAEVFRERGMAPERVRMVGSPKLDQAARHASSIPRATFCAAVGVDPARRIVLFAMQPMDNAADPPRARRAQAAAIRDLAGFAEAAGATLIVRPPPAGQAALLGLSGLASFGTLIVPGPGRPSPFAMATFLAHADLVASVGSTALVEAYLMRRPTLQIDYDPAATGAELRLAAARAGDAAQARTACRRLLDEGFRPDADLETFFDRAFSPGRVADGAALSRIGAALRDIARPVDLEAALARAGRGVDRIALFQGLRRLGVPRRLAARLA